MTRRLSTAPGPTWAWVLLVSAIVAAMGLLRLAVFPDRFVPLAYGLPLLLFIWRRDLRLLWGMTAALTVILFAKVFLLASANPESLGETFLFASMQLAGILVPATAIHILIGQTRELDRAAAQLELSHAELEATNEELAAREEEISQQNEDLQFQTAELEHQTEELGSQTEELQALNEQLLARERTLDEIVTLSATGASEHEVLQNLGTMVERLFAPRAIGAAILTSQGSATLVHPLFGLTIPASSLPSERTFASIVQSADTAAFIADLTLRPDIVLPTLQSGHLPLSLIAAPARVDGTEAIILEVYSRELGEWSELELQLMQWSAEQCGRLWTTARLREDLSRLADSERAARTEAERAAREKDEFVATLAHELRTPVGAILGWSNLLRTIAKSPEELEKGLEVIERNARQQSRLISDLLDMSRAVSGKLMVDLHAVNLSEVVDASIDVIGPSAGAREIALVRNDDGVVPMVRGDADRLQQIFVNVLTNAIKFTPRNGSVRITVSCDDARAHVAVSDTGKGIRPELIPQLFDRYRQADSSSSRSHGGLGLGLSIAKHLAELHGGTIQLLSDGEGRGTTCIVSIPLLAPNAHDNHTASNRAGAEHANGDGVLPTTVTELPNDDGRSSQESAIVVDEAMVRRVVETLSILVVDDDADTLEFVSRLLEEYGAVVHRAHSASEALDRLGSLHPRLVISDIGMPEMDGYELIRRVRQFGNDRVRAVPAIAITAFTRPNDRARALAAGFHVHVPKPVDPMMLMATVVRLCASSGVGLGQTD